uniref:CEP209_CC5 domain-containing protein n=1 Tax=Syphacia muris TaxID=451379 RepID=A0A0N5AFE4_9BILA
MDESETATNTNVHPVELISRIPESPGSRSNYGEFYWDTNGENVYHATETYESDLVLDADVYGRAGSASRLDRTQEDLDKYRQRIDANVEQQKEYSDMIGDLQRKIEEYRRHIATLESQMRDKRTDETSFTLLDPTMFPDVKKEEPYWTQNIESTDYQYMARIDEERRRQLFITSNIKKFNNFLTIIKFYKYYRNDEYRMLLDQEHIQNDQLQHELERLRRDYEATLQEKEQVFQNRERNLTRYLSEEQKKMMDLWTELQRVRKQFAELKNQTAIDLENQKSEFIRVVNNLGGATRQLNLTGVEGRAVSDVTKEATVAKDTLLLEAIRRFQEQQPGQAGVQILNELKLAKAGDTELNSELMKRYEECIERNMELESQQTEFQRKIANLEAELRRSKERLTDNQTALRKLYDIAQDFTVKPETQKRARSLSPAREPLPPAEALQSVRNVLRAKNNEIQQLERKLRNIEKVRDEWTTKNEGLEDAKRRLEKQLADSRRDVTKQCCLIFSLNAIDDFERQVRRLEDKIHSIETEKDASENAKKYLEDEIKRLNQLLQAASDDSEKKARDDLIDMTSAMEHEYKTRIEELTRRIETLQRENTKLKTEANAMKDKERDLEHEQSAAMRRLQEKENALKNLEKMHQDLVNKLEDQRARYEALAIELDKVTNELTTANQNLAAKDQTIKEIKQQRDDYGKQKDELSKKLFDVKHQMETERDSRIEAEKAIKRHLEEIEKLKSEITDYESQIAMIRRHNDELDTQLKGTQAKITSLENEVETSKKETQKLLELNQKLQREKQDILNQKHQADAEIAALTDRLRRAEQEIEKLRAENISLTESEANAREAFAKQTAQLTNLQKDLEEAKNYIAELEAKLSELDKDYADKLREVLSAKDSESTGTTTINDTTITEVRLKEANDKWRIKIEQLENDKEELERRIRDLEDQLAEKIREVEAKDNDLHDLRKKLEVEIEHLQTEIAQLNAQHQRELENEREQYNSNLESMKLVEDELRHKLDEAEKRLAETQDKLAESEREIREWEEKYDTLYNQMQKLKDDIENIRNDAEKEIQKWKSDAYAAHSELKSLEASNAVTKSQLAAANERLEAANKTIADQSTKIRELNAQCRRLEEEITDLKTTVMTKDADLDNALKRLHTIEEKLTTLQLDYDTLRTQNETLCRENDILKARNYLNFKSTNASNENELERNRKLLAECKTELRQRKTDLATLQANYNRVANFLREKEKQNDHLNQLVQSFETRLENLRHELQETSDKVHLVSTDTERNALRSEIVKLQKELQFGKEQMMRKTDEYQSSLEELSNAQRASEDNRLMAVQELESRKYEMADLQSRLENTEQRLQTLQQEYMKVEEDRTLMLDTVRRFQIAANRTITFNTLKDEGGIPESVPFPPSNEFTETVVRPSNTVINIGETLDIKQLETTLQTLINRIERLEKERNEYQQAFNRIKRKSTSTTLITKQDNRFKSLEDSIGENEERRVLEARLESTKQLLRSQEEVLKQRDDERQQMKSKILAAELEARSKEAQLRHLNEQVKNLRTELENSYGDARKLREEQETLEATKFKLETHARNQENEIQRLNTIVSNYDSEKEHLNERIKEISGQLRLTEIKYNDAKEDVDRLKKELMRAESLEAELKKTIEQNGKTATDYAALREQMISTQNELQNANIRKQQLENEHISMRSEIREYKQRIQDLNSRVTELQRQLQDAHNEKNRLEDRIRNLEDVLPKHKNKERDLRQQLDAANNERKTLQKELEELRARIAKLDEDKRKVSQLFEVTKRERTTFIKKVEMLESEKRRTDEAIRETALQREAIEKSLNAMERENKELYRNCAKLQQQIAQLEMENGTRIMDLTARQREEQEKQIQRMQAEKAQIERIIENRERMQQNRVRQLEKQLAVMREQLDSERRRRRDYADRTLACEMGRLGNIPGLRTVNIHSAGFPVVDNDVFGSRQVYSRYVRSTFASNPLTPPVGTSTPTHNSYINRLESSYTVKDTEALREPFVSPAYSSYQHPAAPIVTTTEQERYETLEPSKEIEGKKKQKYLILCFQLKHSKSTIYH